MNQEEKDTININVQLARQKLEQIQTSLNNIQKRSAVTGLKEVIHGLENTVQDLGGRLQIVDHNKEEAVDETDRYVYYIGISAIIFEGILPTFTYSILVGIIVGIILAYTIREVTEEIVNGDDINE